VNRSPRTPLKLEAIDPNLASIYYAGNRTANFISKTIVGMDVTARRKYLAEIRLWLDERLAALDKAIEASSPIIQPESHPLLITA